jgi:hypothetical protein
VGSEECEAVAAREDTPPASFMREAFDKTDVAEMGRKKKRIRFLMTSTAHRQLDWSRGTSAYQNEASAKV